MGVWAAALEALRLEPTFGQSAWTRCSTCGNVHPRGPIPSGSKLCCMACHRTGVERHPALKESARDRIRLQKWVPADGRDEWSGIEADMAMPTKYGGAPKAAIKLTRVDWRDIQYGRKAAPPGYEIDPMNRGFLRPMDPDAIHAAAAG